MSHHKQPLLIFDLDETLMHATETPLPKKPQFQLLYYSVFERPYERDLMTFI